MAITWHRSLYWRFALGFLGFLALILVAQGSLFLWQVMRSPTILPGSSPQSFANYVASDLTAVFAADPDVEFARYIESRSDWSERPFVVVFEDGRVIANAVPVPPPGLIRFAAVRLRMYNSGIDGEPGVSVDTRPGGAFRRIQGGTAMVTSGPRAIASVFVLPHQPPFSLLARQLGPGLLVAAIGLLLVGTVLASRLIVRPVHRRIAALENAARRIGDGDLDARAPESGGDEVAALARAFNRMAADLGARQADVDRADHLRRQLLADVSHELLTPLTTLRGYLETLGMPEVPLDAAARERYLRIVGHESERMERIVHDLLDLARLEAGGGRFEPAAVQVDELLRRVADRHEREASDRGVAIEVQVAPESGAVEGDALRLDQAVDNLVVNALRHTPRGGRIALEARADGHAVVLAVRDTGEGIAGEHLASIFERFYKADAARTGHGGSGLGLSIVKAIAERHGGTVDVTSAVGRGTEFRLRLRRRLPSDWPN